MVFPWKKIEASVYVTQFLVVAVGKFVDVLHGLVAVASVAVVEVLRVGLVLGVDLVELEMAMAHHKRLSWHAVSRPFLVNLGNCLLSSPHFHCLLVVVDRLVRKLAVEQ